ncbi:FAD-dependent oxidoreductase [Actinomadura darangshiensis]|uniref:FAD-dependent oxidoreductase n=1 Tax=Actinomadura darangshiensis TaxID=705336 RepID=A0A4R5B7J7_9ACTN|nr:FAD-dependent monooxygenase [Actinomadura darangshiensis]TDD80670.1 FAD-dependent oxidoreductase [Actinomadura darangshiensis]
MYDAIVVGARCAGSPTAMLLARAGHRVLLLDRAAFPSDTLSTHLIHQPGVAALARWGLLDAVRASGCPPLERVRYRVADVHLDGCAQGVDGQRAAYAPRRHVLDTILARAAATAGAELREHCRITGLLRDETGRVVGVEGDHRGRRFTETARLVIGADGMRSTVARLTDAPYTALDPTLTCAYYSYWTDVPVTGLELHERAGGWVAAVPTNDGATLVLTYFPQDDFRRVRADAARAHLHQVHTTASELGERLRGGRQVERLRGTGDQRNFFRRAAGPGWALVGDAGHHKDSITARGISDAFTQAELLTRHLGGRLTGDPAALDDALRRYADDRDEALTPGYRSTLDVARLAPASDQRLALLRAVQDDPELTATYFDIVAGIATTAALLTPRLLAAATP